MLPSQPELPLEQASYSFCGEIVKTSAGMTKAYTKYLWFETKKRVEYIRITDDVQAFLEEANLRDGFILVSAMHITAGVFINDWEDGLLTDIDQWVEKLAPVNPNYNHTTKLVKITEMRILSGS